jgi:hypothetical protein
METTTRIIPPELQKLQAIASKDNYRPSITGVYFNGKIAAATNGHMLAIKPKPDGVEELPSNEILKFSTANPKKRNNNTFQSIADKLVSTEGEVAEPIDGQYPSIDQLAPNEGEYLTASISADYLLALAKALNDGQYLKPSNKAAQSIVNLAIPLNGERKGNGAAIIIEHAGGRGIGLLMPCHLGGDPIEKGKEMVSRARELLTV